MSEKSINYMARDFNTIKSELISLSKQYYPELADSFSDASVGAWLIDLVAAVGDDLNYYIDRCYNEQNVNTASLMSSVTNMARLNGLKVPGPKAAMCEVEISVTIPGTLDSGPNWKLAPTIKQGAVVSNGSIEFELTEDVNFAEQFNRDAVSNRRFAPSRDARGVVNGYIVTKNVIVSAGRTRVYKRILTKNEIKPFMEVLLPFKNVMGIEGVLFKETSNLAIQPDTFEFYVNAEKFRMADESMTTYRFFEVNSLTDQYIFGQEVETPGSLVVGKDPHVIIVQNKDGKEEYRYYKGSWMPLMQKFITEYTDNGYLKLIFGSGNNSVDVSESGTPSAYGEYQLTKMVNNDLTGILPKSGWTMYILYRDGGGRISNISPGALNRISSVQWVFDELAITPIEKRNIVNSVRVSNVSQGVAGIDSPSVNEIKYLVKYNTSAQDRCVTVKDYELRVKMMPAKFGAPYRCKAIEDNNKILIYTLGLTSDGKLTSYLPDPMKENIAEYLSRFKSLGDYVELRSGNVYSIKAEVDAFIEKGYNRQSVVKSIINVVSNFFNTEDRAMGEDLFIGDLEKQISSIDGVANLIDFRLRYKDTDDSKVPPVSVSDDKLIDLVSTNKVLPCDAQGMYQIENVNDDISVRVSSL